MLTQAAVLLSRNAALPKEALIDLAKRGQAVFTVTCDTCDPRALGDVVGWAREWLPPIQAGLLIESCQDLHSDISEAIGCRRWRQVTC